MTRLDWSSPEINWESWLQNRPKTAAWVKDHPSLYPSIEEVLEPCLYAVRMLQLFGPACLQDRLLLVLEECTGYARGTLINAALGVLILSGEQDWFNRLTEEQMLYRYMAILGISPKVVESEDKQMMWIPPLLPNYADAS